MKDTLKSLQELGATISKILDVSCAAGASIGVLHHNEVIHTAGYGFRDIERKLPPDENTIYHLASLSKSFTAAAVGILVDEKRIAWNQPVSEILPGFNHREPSIQRQATVLDFLSHRTGLATKNALWSQDGTDLLLQPHDLYQTMSYLEAVHPLRSGWLYNNWGYNLAAEIIEKTSNTTWASFLRDRIFAPLKLANTFTEPDPPSDNLAIGYLASPNGQPFPIDSPKISAGTIMQGANGVKSTVTDLLTYYQAVVRAWKDQSHHESSTGPHLPFRNMEQILTGHISLDSDTRYDQSYGAGWAIAELPSPLGAIGINGMFIQNMPVVGKGSTKRTVWYHNGSLVGFFSSVHVLPDTDTVIVVLVNSLAKNDCADWIGQLLLEIVLDNSEKNDYVELAQESASAYDSMWETLTTDLGRSKSDAAAHRSLQEYTGRYFNEVHNWFIEVTVMDDQLHFRFQGLTSQAHRLLHHGSDTFSWPLFATESMRLGRWPDLDATTYIFSFEADDSSVGGIKSLRWVHDPDVPVGEVFQREPLALERNVKASLMQKLVGHSMSDNPCPALA